jgi:hypothetical protein
LCSATSATGSDPATPRDPALRAARMRDMEGEEVEEPPITQQSMAYGEPYTYGGYDPTTHAPWSAGPDFGDGATRYYGSDAQAQDGAQYPYSTQTYPWGMPMSPVDMNTPGQEGHVPTKPAPEGGLGVMWTPAGWAVQDAAMKMALFSAEAKAAGHEMPGEARNYWRTRKCRFFAQGICPHGDACTLYVLHVFVSFNPMEPDRHTNKSASTLTPPPPLARPNPQSPKSTRNRANSSTLPSDATTPTPAPFCTPKSCPTRNPLWKSPDRGVRVRVGISKSAGVTSATRATLRTCTRRRRGWGIAESI